MTAEDRDEPVPGYYRALGKFIDEFAKAERTLATTLFDLADLDSPLAQAIFSTHRVDAYKDAINRILEATQRPDIAERLKEPLDQLGLINGVRNGIVHWGAFATGDDTMMAVNDFLARTPRHVRSWDVSVDILDRMTVDLYKIQVHLLAETLQEEPADLMQQFRERIVEPVRASAWQYTQPPQAPHERARLARLLAQQHQRDASPEKPEPQ